MLTFLIIAVGYIIGIGVCVSWVERDGIRKKQIQIEKDLEELKTLILEQKKKDKQLSDKRVLEAEV